MSDPTSETIDLIWYCPLKCGWEYKVRVNDGKADARGAAEARREHAATHEEQR
ncbi:hypothetical protein [Streptomyces lydicus]|uniref:hypothetical protein n=1 Tax=Streptomyces lydicus TaxID=47763 RepID=UPI003789C703